MDNKIDSLKLAFALLICIIFIGVIILSNPTKIANMGKLTTPVQISQDAWCERNIENYTFDNYSYVDPEYNLNHSLIKLNCGTLTYIVNASKNVYYKYNSFGEVIGNNTYEEWSDLS